MRNKAWKREVAVMPRFGTCNRAENSPIAEKKRACAKEEASSVVPVKLLTGALAVSLLEFYANGSKQHKIPYSYRPRSPVKSTGLFA